MTPILRIVGLMLLLSSITSCLSTKKLIYLQDPNDPKEASGDKVITELETRESYYTLNPGDMFTIQVTSLSPGSYNFLQDIGNTNPQNPSLGGLTVDKDGNIKLPYVGKVYVKGKNIAEAEEILEKTLSEYLESPTVVLRPLNFYITILGEVSKAGRISTFRNNLTIMEAIGLAGGLSDFADRKNIKITRFEDGKAQTHTIDVTDVNVLSSELYYLKSGDIITVRPLKVRVFKQYNVQNINLILSTVSSVLLIVTLVIR